jgi:hypothetical protein
MNNVTQLVTNDNTPIQKCKECTTCGRSIPIWELGGYICEMTGKPYSIEMREII